MLGASLVVALAACARGGSLSPAAPVLPAAQPLTAGYQVIYSFGQFGKYDDGAHPVANLISLGADFYGTTEFGGITNSACVDGCGTVFRISPEGREQIIYRFKGGTDGDLPAAPLTDVNGTLYGTTAYGGTSTACAGGCGTVFALSPDGRSYRTMFSFGGGADGASPASVLTPMNGALYGTTLYGGIARPLCSTGCGTVFSIGLTGVQKVIYRFKGGKDGANPVAGLLRYGSSLYGTAQYGGVPSGYCSTGCGTIFRITPAGFTTVHLFKYSPSSNDGAFPSANLIAVSGELYGTTLSGGEFSDGTVFETSPATGAESVIHSFDSSDTIKDGVYPLAPLTFVSGELYGTTRNGGTTNAGTVFEIATSGAESVLHDFIGKPDGATPQAGLILSGGALYGTTVGGGAHSLGSVFRLTP